MEFNSLNRNMVIDTDNYPEKYKSVFGPLEEMVRKHIIYEKCIGVLLDWHPEMGDRTDSLDVILEELFEDAYERQMAGYL